jgi:hypothetical protein
MSPNSRNGGSDGVGAAASEGGNAGKTVSERVELPVIHSDARRAPRGSVFIALVAQRVESGRDRRDETAGNRFFAWLRQG